jgi:hypothetical protein
LFSSGHKSQQGIKGISNGQSLLSIVRRDEQDRKARRVGERNCFWRSRPASPCIPERFTIKYESAFEIRQFASLLQGAFG